jgi:hypothetical protein
LPPIGREHFFREKYGMPKFQATKKLINSDETFFIKYLTKHQSLGALFLEQDWNRAGM